MGAILAGGGSTRFGGRPKGLEPVGGTRAIDRVAAALRTVAGEIVVVSNDSDAPNWLPGARVRGDVRPGRGSLIGLHAAIAQAGGPVLVVAWDMPFVSPELMGLIADHATRATHAVMPQSDRGPEPCCAWYAPSCLPWIESMLDAGDLRLGDLATRLPSCDHIARSEIAAIGDPARLFFNVNTPADLVRADAMASDDSARR